MICGWLGGLVERAMILANCIFSNPAIKYRLIDPLDNLSQGQSARSESRLPLPGKSDCNDIDPVQPTWDFIH